MAIIGQFGDFTFEVSADYVRSFESLTISATQETNEKTGSKQTYVTYKNGKPIEMSFTVKLVSYLGVDVQADMLSMLNAVQHGTGGYFYVAGKKLFPFSLIMTKASVKNVVLSPGGKWVSCEVAITLQQASKQKVDGTSGSSGSSTGSGSSGSSSSKKKSTKTTSTTKTKSSSKTSGKKVNPTALGAAVGAATSVVQSGKTTSKNQTMIAKAFSIIKNSKVYSAGVR